MPTPVPVLVTYRPRPGAEAKLLALVKRHWPTLRKVGLAGPAKPRVWRATDKRTGRRYFVELFEWKDGLASDLAHRTPEVMAIWGTMEPLLESMELAVVKAVELAPRRRRAAGLGP
jgi:hypothetical protein